MCVQAAVSILRMPPDYWFYMTGALLPKITNAFCSRLAHVLFVISYSSTTDEAIGLSCFGPQVSVLREYAWVHVIETMPCLVLQGPFI